MDGAWRQIESPDVGDIGSDGAGTVRSLIVAAPRQLGEALLLQDGGDGRRTEGLAIAGEGSADVVDGEVLFAEGDDLLAQPLLLTRRPSVAGGRKKSRWGPDRN